MLRSMLSAVFFAASTFGAFAGDLVTKTSSHTVVETTDRLQAAVEGAGATVFARVNHAAGAEKVGMELRPTELLVFGNPKLGTPAMLDNQTAGLDLPLRVLIYEDSNGTVRVSYHAPSSLASTHNLPSDAKYIKMMTGALDKLTSKATSAE